MRRESLGKAIGLGAMCALVVLSCLGGSAAAIHVSSSRCRPLGSKTIAIEAHARVYSLPVRGAGSERGPEDVRVVGCLFGTGHLVRLGTTKYVWSRYPARGLIDPEVAAVAAPFAAYSTRFQGIDFDRIWVIVRNLDTGEALQAVNANPKLGVEAESSVVDMAVSHSGAVAWISEGRSLAGGHGNAEVALSAPGQPAEILEEGGIDPESLELHGNHLTWTSEGARHSAEMP